jgi:hypothetical protein
MEAVITVKAGMNCAFHIDLYSNIDCSTETGSVNNCIVLYGNIQLHLDVYLNF